MSTTNDDLRDHVRRQFQRQANAYARKCGYGRATRFTFSKKRKTPRIIEARSWGYETKGGTPIRFPSAYAKRGWSNMRYVPAECWVEIPQPQV